MSRRSLDGEEWRQVPGCDGRYEVSNHGRVYSVTLGRFIPQQHSIHGYCVVYIRRGTTRRAEVHRLVLEAFVGPCPEGMVCCHANGVRDDNRVENLRWGTPSDNGADASRHHRERTAAEAEERTLLRSASDERADLVTDISRALHRFTLDEAKRAADMLRLAFPAAFERDEQVDIAPPEHLGKLLRILRERAGMDRDTTLATFGISLPHFYLLETPYSCPSPALLEHLLTAWKASPREREVAHTLRTQVKKREPPKKSIKAVPKKPKSRNGHWTPPGEAK